MRDGSPRAPSPSVPRSPRSTPGAAEASGLTRVVLDGSAPRVPGLRSLIALALISMFPGPLAAEEGRRLPRWYEENRVRAHTRLGSRWLGEEIFHRAPTMLRDLGARVFTRHVKSGGEGPWWPTEFGVPAAFAGERNVALELIREARARGLRMITYFWMMSDERIGDSHPRWLARGPDGSVVRGPRGRWLCLNSPYREIVKGRLVELAGMGADAIKFDAEHQPPDGCWCSFCEQKFVAETGLALPQSASLVDSGYRELLRFYNRTIESAFSEFRAAIRETNAETQLIVSATFLPGLWNPRMRTEFVRLADGAKSEWAHGVTQSRQIFRSDPELERPPRDARMALGWTLLRDASEGRPPHIWTARLKTEQQLLFASAALLTAGCIADLDIFENALANRAYRAYRASFDLGRIVGPALAGALPLRWAAIHFPEAARDRRLPDVARAWKEVLAPMVWSYVGLRRARVPVGIVTDGHLERGDLSGYQVLFLAAAAELSEPQRAVVEDFRHRGGIVVVAPRDFRWHRKSEALERVHRVIRGLERRLGAPVDVTGGPRTLSAVPFRSDDGRILVALANDFSWIRQARRGEDLPADPDVPPVDGVSVFIRGPVPERVAEVTTGRSLDPQLVEGGVRIDVPSFAVMALIEVRYPLASRET